MTEKKKTPDTGMILTSIMQKEMERSDSYKKSNQLESKTKVKILLPFDFKNGTQRTSEAFPAHDQSFIFFKTITPNPEILSSKNIRRNKLPNYEFISQERHYIGLVMKDMPCLFCENINLADLPEIGRITWFLKI